MLNMIVFLLIAIISVNASEEHLLLNDNGVQHIEINQNHPQIQNNANQIALLNNFNEHEMVQNIHNPIALNQISEYRIKLTKDITIIIQDTGAHNGRQKYSNISSIYCICILLHFGKNSFSLQLSHSRINTTIFP